MKSLFKLFGLYHCVTCQVIIKDIDITEEHIEKELCPDCSHWCERCETLLDYDGTYEHCG